MAGTRKLWFKVGDTIVYPGYGVGLVQDIRERQMGDTQRVFCVLLFKDSTGESKVLIPLDNIEEVGLRPLSTKRRVEEALAYLGEGEPEILPSWKDRFAQHGSMLASGDLMSVVRVLKALWILNNKKPLSFREKKMYQKALGLIVAEACEVKVTSRETMEQEILRRLSPTP